MRKVVRLGGLLALASGIALGDAIVLGSNSFVNVPVNIASALGSNIPYWDNASGDGPQMNIGYFLTGTGTFRNDPGYTPTQYESQNNGAGNADSPSEISLMHNSPYLVLTLLGNYTMDESISFGYYDASQTTAAAAVLTEQKVFGTGSLTPGLGVGMALSMPLGEDYGFYVTRCLMYANGINSTCLQATTWFSNASLDSSDTNHQHFAIFNSPATGVYYIGIEDWFNNTGEGYGDYNDVMFELNTGPAPVPEPASLALTGAGLLGIGWIYLRARKNRSN